MANTAVVTATGTVKSGGGGQLYAIHVTKVGTGASSITVYDNTSATGRILWQGDGLSQGAFVVGGSPVTCSTGLHVVLAGTTNPTVVVVYE